MGFSEELEERKLEKEVERQKELADTTTGVQAQVEMLQCDEIGNQFIEECDIKEYESGVGKKEDIMDEIESPHTGERMGMKQVHAVDTTNEEDLEIGILGDASSNVKSFLTGIGWKNSAKGMRTFNRRMFMLQSSVIAFLLAIIFFDIEPSTAIIESRPFLVATTGVSVGGIIMFLEEYWHREHDNYFDMRFLCLDHAMDGNLHVGISLDDPNYLEHLEDWFGEESQALINALEDLEENFIEKIDEKDELVYKLDAERRREKDKTGKKIAERLADAKMDYQNMGSPDNTKVALYVFVTAVGSIAGTLGILYLLSYV